MLMIHQIEKRFLAIMLNVSNGNKMFVEKAKAPFFKDGCVCFREDYIFNFFPKIKQKEQKEKILIVQKFLLSGMIRAFMKKTLLKKAKRCAILFPCLWALSCESLNILNTATNISFQFLE
jgi:hypothetical protein